MPWSLVPSPRAARGAGSSPAQVVHPYDRLPVAHHLEPRRPPIGGVLQIEEAGAPALPRRRHLFVCPISSTTAVRGRILLGRRMAAAPPPHLTRRCARARRTPR